jgi:hypothetical protein
MGGDCVASIKALREVAGNPQSSAPAARASLTGLSAIGAKPERAAMDALAAIGRSAPGALRDEAAVALGVVAVRAPDAVLAWLDAGNDEARGAAIDLLRIGFERLEEDFAEEQFFAAARAAYWTAAETSPTRTRIAGLIDKLEF